MSIRLKFNLAMFLVFALGFAAASFLTEKILLKNAKEEVALKASIMMEAARSMRSRYASSSSAIRSITSGRPTSWGHRIARHFDSTPKRRSS